MNQVSHITADSLTEPQGKPKDTGVGTFPLSEDLPNPGIERSLPAQWWVLIVVKMLVVMTFSDTPLTTGMSYLLHNKIKSSRNNLPIKLEYCYLRFADGETENQKK